MIQEATNNRCEGWMSMDKTGFIYVLTNESFHKDNWIKIGYTENVERRVKELSGTSVPLPYEVYCTYEIPHIEGEKDPDKWVHDMICALNPSIRIAQNREFFELYPWDAYRLLNAMARIHGRGDKLRRNAGNTIGDDENVSNKYSVEELFPQGTLVRALYDEIKSITLEINKRITETPMRGRVLFRKDGQKILALWPKDDWIEVVLRTRLGQITDDDGMLYDISDR